MNVAARTASWIPYDAEVEYLESDSNQYIATGVYPGPTTVFKFKAAFLETESTAAPSQDQPNDYGIADNFFTGTGRFEAGYNRAGLWLGLGTGAGGRYTGGTFDTNTHTFEVDCINRQCKKDDFTWTSSGYGGGTFGIELWLFCRRVDLSAGVISIFSNKSQCYWAKLYSSGVLVRDFVPVRKQGVGFMYDRVSKQLFGNAGTGAFAIGPDKT